MRTPLSFLVAAALSLPSFAVPRFAQGAGGAVATPVKTEQEGWKLAPPKELFDIERVVDADTIYVKRGGEVLKLRLLSVDTEEKLATNATDPGKPSTVFGEDCAQWANEFFKELGHDGQFGQIGLLFPTGVEERDFYGRTLCYVVLPDGRNFNLLLVQLGKSPYFNKYGNSQVCHDAMVAAQRKAREQHVGIWNPATNTPKSAGAPAAKRPYERLLPWWDARAAAVDAYRAQRAKDAAHVAAADAPAELEAALAASKKGETVAVFGSIEKLFDEDDGSQTVLFRSGAKDKAFRARVPKESRAALAKLDLAHLSDDYRQNYVWVKGVMTMGGRGFEMQCNDASGWSLAGPEPAAAAGH
jgi:micrococcal nuclease